MTNEAISEVRKQALFIGRAVEAKSRSFQVCVAVEKKTRDFQATTNVKIQQDPSYLKTHRNKIFREDYFREILEIHS